MIVPEEKIPPPVVQNGQLEQSAGTVLTEKQARQDGDDPKQEGGTGVTSEDEQKPLTPSAAILAKSKTNMKLIILVLKDTVTNDGDVKKALFKYIDGQDDNLDARVAVSVLKLKIENIYILNVKLKK